MSFGTGDFFEKNPWEGGDENAKKLEEEVVSDFNQEFSEDGIQAESIEDDSVPREKGILTTAATILVLKFANESGPKFFKKVVDKIEDLLEKNKIDIDKKIKILSYETTARDLIGGWKEIGKTLWPKAKWDTTDDIGLDSYSLEKVNAFLGEMKQLALSPTQIEKLGGEITSIMMQEQSKKTSALNTVTLDTKDIQEINTMLATMDQLDLSPEIKEGQKFNATLTKLKELINRKKG